MKTAIITVGKEVLTGKTLNTNLMHIASNLQTIGIDVNRSFVIDDIKEEYNRILDIVDEDIIFFTGGLGPTIDDITRESTYDYFNVKTFLDQEIVDTIKQYFDRMSIKMKDTNLKQAIRPIHSTVLINNEGTAPGVYFEIDGKHIILLPGPPSELKPMIPVVLDILSKKLDIKLYSEGFKLVGTGESFMEDKLLGFYELHPNVNIAPYAGLGEIKYIFTSSSKTDLVKCKKDFYDQFSHFIYGSLEDTLESVVVDLLKELNYKISFAESCTGGLLSGRLLNVSGSSSVYDEGIITYSNQSKMKHLNVSKDVLDTFGAVSNECAYQMVDGLNKLTKCDIGISVTGIAGPTGGTEEKPVGLVHFGLYINGTIKTYKFVFNGDRHKVRTRSVVYALNLVRGELLDVKHNN